MRPYLRAANVKWNGLSLEDVKEMNFSESEVDTFRLMPGDILLSEASGSSSEVGKPAIWRGEIDECCFQNTLIRVRSNDVENRYLFWFFKWLALSGQFARGSRGVGIHHLGAKALSDWPVPLAPLAEQDRIVAAIEEQFSRLDVGTTALEHAHGRLSTLRRLIFATSVRMGQEVALGDILLDIEAGKSFRTTGIRARRDQWAVIKVSAMTWGRFLEEENKAIPEGVPVVSDYEIRPGDVLLSRANTSEYVGATVRVERCRPRLLLSDKSMRLHALPEIDKAWLTYALSSPWLRDQMSAVATGTSDSMRNISQEKVRRLRLRVPSHEEQKRLSKDIEMSLTLVESLSKTISSGLDRSRHLRMSILKTAFSGKLVPQLPTDEPASSALRAITAASRTSNGAPFRTSRNRRAVAQ
jgi:type I restriction enzyme S subunit